MLLDTVSEAAFLDELFCKCVLLKPLTGRKAGDSLAVPCTALLVHVRIYARGVCHQSLLHAVNAPKESAHIKLRHEPQRAEERSKALRERLGLGAFFKLSAGRCKGGGELHGEHRRKEIQLPLRQRSCALKAAQIFEQELFVEAAPADVQHIAARGGYDYAFAAGAQPALSAELTESRPCLAHGKVAVIQKPAAAVRHGGSALKAALDEPVDRVYLFAASPQQSLQLAYGSGEAAFVEPCAACRVFKNGAFIHVNLHFSLIFYIGISFAVKNE